MANQITVDILADTRSLVAGVKETNSQLGSLKNSLGGIKTAFSGLAAAFGFQVGLSFIKDALKGAEDDRVQFQRLTTYFGDDITALTNQINSLSKKWKVDDGAIAKFVADLAGTLKAGLDSYAPKIAESSLVLAKLSGKPVEDVVALWQKVLRDGKITASDIQRLGIQLTEDQEKKFNSLKTTAEKLDFLMGVIMSPENVKKAQGMITATEKWNYFMERLKDTIGTLLLPVIEKLMGWYEKLSPGQKDLVDKTAALVVGLAALASVFAPVLFAISQMITIVKALREAQILATVAQLAFNAAAAINPYVAIIAGIIALIAGIVLLVKNWDTVKNAFKTGVEAIKNAFNSVISWFGNVGNSIKNAIGNLFNIGKQFGVDIINGLVNGIKAMALAPVNAIKSVVSGVTGAIKGILGIKSPSKVFAGFGKNIVQGLSKGIDGAQQIAVDSMASLSGGLTLATPTGTSRGAVNITINAGLGTDPYELGRAVRAALNKYDGVNGR